MPFGRFCAHAVSLQRVTRCHRLVLSANRTNILILKKKNTSNHWLVTEFLKLSGLRFTTPITVMKDSSGIFAKRLLTFMFCKWKTLRVNQTQLHFIYYHPERTSSGATNCVIPYWSLSSINRPIRVLFTFPAISTIDPWWCSRISPQFICIGGGGGGSTWNGIGWQNSANGWKAICGDTAVASNAPPFMPEKCVNQSI